jgi:hypothetical protein
MSEKDKLAAFAAPVARGGYGANVSSVIGSSLPPIVRSRIPFLGVRGRQPR